MSPRFAPINPGVGATAPSADGLEQDQDTASDATTSRPHDATRGPEDASPRRQRAVRTGRVAKPAVLSARAMTVRMDPGEADEVDQFVLDLRGETGQRLDKADVVRELIRLAQEDHTVRRKLTKRLQ